MHESATSIADVLLALAERQPAAPALRVPGRAVLAYGHLGEQIRHVLERLGQWGIEPGDLVCAALPSRPELAVAMATLPSSCTFAPLAPLLPGEAYARLLARLNPKAVLVRHGDDHAIRGAARRLGVAEIDVIPVQDDGAGLFTLDLASEVPPLSRPRSLDSRIAYMLTSSGTTGRRKLVPVAHSTVLAYARAIAGRLAFTADDVGVHIRPMYLGSGLRSGLINPLLTGSSVVCLPEGDVKGVFALRGESQPTFLSAGFSVFRSIARRAHGFRAAAAGHRFRFMLSGAGPLDPDDADRLEQMFGVPMLTGYSSTETSRISIDPLPPGIRKRGSAGVPLVNEVAVLDSRGHIHPRDVSGELVVRGPMVFQGYFDDTELNDTSFVGDWFRTGDLGRIDEDGYVYVSGRIKDTINRGGEKISPTEIDLAIESLAGVSEAAAFGVPHPSLGEEVVAAVVREDGTALDEAAVVAHVNARLGARSAPRRVYLVDRLPRTDSGKVQRGALLGLVEAGSSTPSGDLVGASAVSPSLSPLEGALTGLWSSCLQGVTVGREDDFFLLGGDSLGGELLLTYVEELFGVRLPLELLYGKAATVAGMARTIEAIRAHEGRDAGVRSGAGHLPPANRTEEVGAPEFARLRPMPLDEILARQREFLRTWKGTRATPESLTVTLNDGGACQGLFWCLQSYKELNRLAQCLGPDQPVHGMRSGARVMTYTDENVSLLAGHYATEMIALQRDGPFVLGGNCQGGRIARAIASELREAGRKVSLLILMEERTFSRYAGPVALLFGRDSDFNPYRTDGDPDTLFRRLYPAGYTVDIISGSHGHFFERANIGSLAATLKRRLLDVSVSGQAELTR